MKIEINKAGKFLAAGAVEQYEPAVSAAQQALEQGTCAGNDFLGWLHLPSQISPEFIDEINATAQVIKDNCDAVVVAGIGGSYLGAKAVIAALDDNFTWLKKSNGPRILFAGNNISEDYLSELIGYLKGVKFGVINISKSGTTTETAITFRLMRKLCEEQMGKELSKKVIVAITDAKKGAARTTADKEGYKSFIIPDNVGGRFSVLTPVGLLPIACAGYDIAQLVKGAQDMEKACDSSVPFSQNPCAIYAATATHSMPQARKSRFSSTISQSSITWQSGGNNSTERAKARTRREYSPHQSTSQPTFTQWDSGFRTVSAPSSRQSFPSTSQTTASQCRQTGKTSTDSTSLQESTSMRSTTWQNSAHNSHTLTVEFQTSASPSHSSTSTTLVS